MSDITNGYDLNGSRRRHVGEENHYDKRMRERQEAKQAEKKQHATHAAAQQIQAQQWREWFRTCFYHELDGDEGLYAAIGEGLADMKREAYEKARAEYAPQIAAVKQGNAELQAQVNELKGKLELITSLAEMERALDARQAGRDAAKRGAKGEPGAAGKRGEKGEKGEKGDKGERGVAPKFHSAQLDREKYRITILLDDGTSIGPLELRGLFEQFNIDMGWY